MVSLPCLMIWSRWVPRVIWKLCMLEIKWIKWWCIFSYITSWCEVDVFWYKQCWAFWYWGQRSWVVLRLLWLLCGSLHNDGGVYFVFSWAYHDGILLMIGYATQVWMTLWNLNLLFCFIKIWYGNLCMFNEVRKVISSCCIAASFHVALLQDFMLHYCKLLILFLRQGERSNYEWDLFVEVIHLFV